MRESCACSHLCVVFMQSGAQDDHHLTIEGETNLAASVASIADDQIVVTSSTEKAGNEFTVTHL